MRKKDPSLYIDRLAHYLDHALRIQVKRKDHTKTRAIHNALDLYLREQLGDEVIEQLKEKYGEQDEEEDEDLSFRRTG